MDHQQITRANQNERQRESVAATKQNRPVSAPLHPHLYLPRMLGNQAYGRLIQAKLTVNQPGDIYEQEADRVAEQVMRMPVNGMTGFQPVSEGEQSPRLQRKCAACASGGSLCPTCAEEEEYLQRKPLVAQITPLVQRQEIENPEEEEEETLQAKEAPGATPTVSPAMESHISAMRGGGQPLPPLVRAFFEPRFGYDFNQVRVHAGVEAATTARGIRARAYTVGRDIVFGSGEYAPATVEGKRLLAHELVHVVQQTNGIERHIQRTVDNVEINCADNQIRFDHDGSTTSYTLDRCDVTDGTYDARVTLGHNRVDFDLGTMAPGAQFDFHYSIAPGQPNPNSFFAGQTRVNIFCTHVPRLGVGRGDIHFNAKLLSAQDFLELTGRTMDTIPEGVMVPLANIINRTAPSIVGPAVAGASHYSPTPWSFIPRDTVGVLWVQGHTSIFSNPASALSPTIRGYRGNLGNYVGELIPLIGPRFTLRLHEGVPGSFANDAWFPLMAGEQYWVFAPRSSSQAEAFAARLQGTQYGGEYTYSPPRAAPDAILGEVRPTEARLNAELRARGIAPMCTNNCITVPSAEIEAAIGGRPTTLSGVDVISGRGPGGTIDPHYAGRGRLMTEAMGEGPLPADVNRLNLRVTAGGSASMFLIRGGGRIMLVYGIYQTRERIRGAVGTEQLPTVITEEAGSWTGGILGSALGGAIAGAVFCAPTGPIDAVCVIGGFLGGLLFGIVGSAIGHEGGHVVGETVVTPVVERVRRELNLIEYDWTRQIYNLYGVPFF